MDDTSYFWTSAQAIIQKAISDDKIKISRTYGDNNQLSVDYFVKRVFCDEDGNIEMSVDYKHS